MYDEDAHSKAEQAEGGEIEVKAVCELPYVRATLCRAAGQSGRDPLKRWPTHRLLCGDYQTAQAALGIQNALGHKNVRDGCVRRDAWLHHDGCIDKTFQLGGCCGVCKDRAILQKIGQRNATARHWSQSPRCGEWINAHKADLCACRANLPFDHRSDQPPCTAQCDECLLRDILPRFGQELIVLPFAQRGSSGVITGAGL